MKIKITNLHPRRRLPLARLRRAVNKLPDQFDVAFIDDREMKKLKGSFAGVKKTTDVMAFPAGIDEDECKGLSLSEKKVLSRLARPERKLGEVAISLDTAVRQAGQRKIPVLWEMILLIVHGWLHLEGYLDTSLGDWKQIRRLEFETMVRIL